MTVDNTSTYYHECLGVDSCGFMEFDLLDIDDAQIKCGANGSCAEVMVTVTAVETFSLWCIDSGSCTELMVDLVNVSNASITCYEAGACDMLRIKSNSDSTQLRMVQNSVDVVVDVPSGYLPQNLDCNPSNVYITISPEFPTVNVSLNATFGHFGDTAHILPCEGILFNGNTTSSFLPCTVEYEQIWQYIDESQFHPMFDCYGNFQLDELYTVSCLTSLAPTLEPTGIPSESPSPAPTNAPSTAPSAAPTIPSLSPSQTPTGEPTLEPSPGPTMEPTMEPTNHPSTMPTPAPSNAPTVAPTPSPTVSPSPGPTLEPTLEPSVEPTSDPTAAPTNSPIAADDFDTLIQTEYEMDNLNEGDIYSIATDTAQQTAYIEFAIKSALFDSRFLSYDEFMVTIIEINDVVVADISENEYYLWTEQVPQEPVVDASGTVSDTVSGTVSDDVSDTVDIGYSISMNTEIQCNEGSECQWIQNNANTQEFMDKMGVSVRSLYNNSNLMFSMPANAAMTVIDKDAITISTDWPTIILLSVCGCLCVLALPAFIWNKLWANNKSPNISIPGFNRVDEARFLAIVLYALQIWDFYSDVMLSLYIVDQPQFPGDIMYFVSGIGSIAFTVIPYATNLVMAARVKKMVGTNAAAKGWFQAHSSVFVMLTALSGGCHAALALVSSNIFGVNMFSSGLTQYELKQMAKMKVFGTVIIENLPQLACQILFSIAEEKVTTNVLLAASASFLSVIATVLSYLIERDETGSKVVQYYISTECLQRGINAMKEEESDSERDIAVTNKDGVITMVTSKSDTANLEDGNVSTGIAEMEKVQIIQNRGRQEALAKSLAECYHISWNNIEIGATTISKYGATTHIIHYVYDEDLQDAEVETMGSGGNLINAVRGEEEHTKQLFFENERTISLAFQKHFSVGVFTKPPFISNEDFTCSYHVDRVRTASMDSVGISTMRAMRSTDYLMHNLSEGIFYTTQYVKDTVHSFFETEGITLRHEQLERLNSLWDEEGNYFNDPNQANQANHAMNMRVSDTKSVVLQKENTEQRFSNMSKIEPDHHLLQEAIEMALQGDVQGDVNGAGGRKDTGDNSMRHLDDSWVMAAVHNLESDQEMSASAPTVQSGSTNV